MYSIVANWLGEEVQSLLLVWIFYHTFYGCLGQKLSSAMRTRVTLLLVRNLEIIRSKVGLDDSGTFFWVGGTYMKSRRATGSGSGSTEVPGISQSGRLRDIASLIMVGMRTVFKFNSVKMHKKAAIPLDLFVAKKCAQHPKVFLQIT